MSGKAVLVAALALVISGCAATRKVEVGSGSNTSAAVFVNNMRSSMVTVTYSDGGATRNLGEVGPGETKRFVVVSQSSTVALYARTSAGSTLGPYTVSLTGGSGQTITVQ